MKNKNTQAVSNLIKGLFLQLVRFLVWYCVLSAHLYGRVSVLDVVLQVAHQHQVAGLVPA